MLITNAYAGWPGCTHDARVLRNSRLYRNAELGNMFDADKFIIGDSAYPVKPWLITCFKDNGHLAENQRRFNRKLASMRQIVERVIGHVKCRFRRLQNVHLYDLESVARVAFCGCILHNLCILADDDIEEFIADDPHHNFNNYAPQIHGIDREGMDLRDRLMERLN